MNKMVTSLPSPPPFFNQSSNNPLTHFVHHILSLDGNIMLAAIISLLLVILFVLLLHVYAKWFLGQARYNQNSPRNSSSSVSIPGVLGSRFHHFNTFTIDTTIPDDPTPTKGLEPSIISSIPLIVFKDEDKHGLECVICLTVFEEKEVGRKLPKCGHAFHVDCIDMWLHSHSTCPICRASVVGDDGKILDTSTTTSIQGDDDHGSESMVEIIVENPSADQNVIVASSSSSLQVQDAILLNIKGLLERG